MLIRRLKAFAAHLMGRRGWSDGHFYSPSVGIEDVDRLKSQAPADDLAGGGVAYDESRQIALVEGLLSRYGNEIFHETRNSDARYYFGNPSYAWADGAIAQAMIRSLKPARIIEIGAGLSTCLICDVNRKYFDGGIEFHSVDPYVLDDDGLAEVIANGEVVFHQRPVQEVALDFFDMLEEGDVLFVDSSHVAKAASDVNWLFFRVLPRLKQGVVIHVHDIFFPFEYPIDWIVEGRSWNEAYLLRAFLQFNTDFQLLLMNDAVGRARNSLTESVRLPFEKNSGGALWMWRARKSEPIQAAQPASLGDLVF
ncbi:class I SAM-dependent methyltransferase [Luteimonas sp. Y-2-2-4F]|nr:class I SAM-dependent methyltransferase [Luteimonas sp. Y-2-2-4F]MCD9030760.1 class I SAM-dependent methyltransferase [Luteimonas sp. Y-2-2-4F]